MLYRASDVGCEPLRRHVCDGGGTSSTCVVARIEPSAGLDERAGQEVEALRRHENARLVVEEVVRAADLIGCDDVQAV